MGERELGIVPLERKKKKKSRGKGSDRWVKGSYESRR